MKKHLLVLASLLAVSGCTTRPAETPIGLPALEGSAQTQRFAALQYALENFQGGQPTVWQASGDARGSVAPLETVRSSTYGWCRDYEELITSGPKRYRLVGIACRKPGLEQQGCQHRLIVAEQVLRKWETTKEAQRQRASELAEATTVSPAFAGLRAALGRPSAFHWKMAQSWGDVQWGCHPH